MRYPKKLYCKKHTYCSICHFKHRKEGEDTCGGHPRRVSLEPWAHTETTKKEKCLYDTLRLCRTARNAVESKVQITFNPNATHPEEEKLVGCLKYISEELPEELYGELEDMMFWGEKC